MLSARTIGPHRVVEEEGVGAGELEDLLAQRVGGERPGGDDARALGNLGDLLADDLDLVERRDALGDLLRKALAVDGERLARRHPVVVGGRQEQRIEASHLLV